MTITHIPTRVGDYPVGSLLPPGRMGTFSALWGSQHGAGGSLATGSPTYGRGEDACSLSHGIPALRWRLSGSDKKTEKPEIVPKHFQRENTLWFAFPLGEWGRESFAALEPTSLEGKANMHSAGDEYFASCLSYYSHYGLSHYFGAGYEYVASWFSYYSYYSSLRLFGEGGLSRTWWGTEQPASQVASHTPHKPVLTRPTQHEATNSNPRRDTQPVSAVNSSDRRLAAST